MAVVVVAVVVLVIVVGSGGGGGGGGIDNNRNATNVRRNRHNNEIRSDSICTGCTRTPQWRASGTISVRSGVRRGVRGGASSGVRRLRPEQVIARWMPGHLDAVHEPSLRKAATTKQWPETWLVKKRRDLEDFLSQGGDENWIAGNTGADRWANEGAALGAPPHSLLQKNASQP